MDENKLLNQIDKDIFTRQDIIMHAKILNNEFRDSLIRNLIEKLLREGYIVRVGRNQYQKKDMHKSKHVYENKYSIEALELMDEMNEAFPSLDYRIWELSWLNEFLNHMVSHNRIFIEVEMDGCEYVFSTLHPKHMGKLLLRPNMKELQYYSTENGIIVDRLVSESPRGNTKTEVPIEKIIVDLFANKTLASTISKGDYPDILEQIFSKYYVDQAKMLRYASRRNKKKEIIDFITHYTDIKLAVNA